MTTSHRLFFWLQRHARLIAIFLLACFVITAAVYVTLKYQTFSYNALDLGIYRQVLAHTAQGDLYGMTIHPHSYLGDHMELLLIVLAPLYALFPFAETLLVLQILAVALGIILASRLVPNTLSGSWKLLLGLVLAASPLVHNIIAFEFHFLPFAIPLLLAACICYREQRFAWYVIWLSLAMLVREDIGLIAIGMAVMALLERRSRRWWATPLLFGAAYFAGAMWLSGQINGEAYKFLAYYGWLGDSVHSATAYAATHPWDVLLKLSRLQNIMFVISLMLLFAGLPLLRMIRIVPVSFVAIAMFLTSAGADGIALQTHYTALFLPFLVWASVEGLERFPYTGRHFWHRIGFAPSRGIAAGLLAVVTLYAAFTISPWRPSAWTALATRTQDPLTLATRDIVRNIPASAPGISSYATLPHLAGRMELYSMHYVFRGKRQLSETPYMPPPSAEWALWDSRDMLFYDIQYEHDETMYASGGDRIQQYLSDAGLSVSAMRDSMLIFTKAPPEAVEPVAAVPAPNTPATHFGPLALHEARIGSIETTPYPLIPVTFVWQRRGVIEDEIVLRLSYSNIEGEILGSRDYPIAYGLYSPADWSADVAMEVRYNLIPPALPHGTYSLQIELFAREGYIGLDPTLQATIQTTAVQPLGAAFTIGSVAL